MAEKRIREFLDLQKQTLLFKGVDANDRTNRTKL